MIILNAMHTIIIANICEGCSMRDRLWCIYAILIHAGIFHGDHVSTRVKTYQITVGLVSRKVVGILMIISKREIFFNLIIKRSK